MLWKTLPNLRGGKDFVFQLVSLAARFELTQVLAVGLPDVEAPTVDEYVLGRGGIQSIPLFLCGGEHIIEFRRPPIWASAEPGIASNGAARIRYSLGFHATNLPPAAAAAPADHAAPRPATDA